MVYVHLENITFNRPNKTFLYVMMNKISSLISQNQLHTLNRIMAFISFGGFYVMNHQMLEHIKLSRRFF